MVSVASFGDFVLVTTEAYLRGQRDVIREFVERTYLFGEMLYGGGTSDALQGGSKVSDAVTLEDPGTAKFFGSDSDTFIWKNPQTFVGWSVEWRKAITHYTWARDEKTLQGSEEMTRAARFKVFKRVLDNKVKGAFQSLYNLVEAALWNVPDASKMETTDEGVPNSIPVYLNEFSNGLFKNPAAAVETDFTVIEGINPVTFPRWQGQFAQYTDRTNAFNPDPLGSARNVMDAFTTAHRLTGFKPMRGAREGVFTATRDAKRKIACSGSAWDGYSNLTRKDQDQYRYGPNDGSVPNPVNKGVELIYCSALDGKALYPNVVAGRALADPASLISDDVETAASATGPRYYLLDCEYIRPVFHITDFIVMHEITHHHNQPLTYVRPITAKYNIVNRSLQRNAIIGPELDTA